MVFHDSVDWGRDLQVMLDALVSKSIATFLVTGSCPKIPKIFLLYLSLALSLSTLQTAYLEPSRVKLNCIPPNNPCHSTFPMRIWYNITQSKLSFACFKQPRLSLIFSRTLMTTFRFGATSSQCHGLPRARSGLVWSVSTRYEVAISAGVHSNEEGTSFNVVGSTASIGSHRKQTRIYSLRETTRNNVQVRRIGP